MLGALKLYSVSLACNMYCRLHVLNYQNIVQIEHVFTIYRVEQNMTYHKRVILVLTQTYVSGQRQRIKKQLMTVRRYF